LELSYKAVMLLTDSKKNIKIAFEKQAKQKQLKKIKNF